MFFKRHRSHARGRWKSSDGAVRLDRTAALVSRDLWRLWKGTPRKTIHVMNRDLREIRDWVGLARTAKYKAKTLAQLCHCSLRLLELHFECCWCKPPESWLREVRLWESVRLMMDGQAPKAAAGNTGFKDLSHFYHRFRDNSFRVFMVACGGWKRSADLPTTR